MDLTVWNIFWVVPTIDYGILFGIYRTNRNLLRKLKAKRKRQNGTNMDCVALITEVTVSLGKIAAPMVC